MGQGEEWELRDSPFQESGSPDSSNRTYHVPLLPISFLGLRETGDKEGDPHNKKWEVDSMGDGPRWDQEVIPHHHGGLGRGSTGVLREGVRAGGLVFHQAQPAWYFLELQSQAPIPQHLMPQDRMPERSPRTDPAESCSHHTSTGIVRSPNHWQGCGAGPKQPVTTT